MTPILSLLLACSSPPPAPPPVPPGPPDFSWVEEGRLAAMALPGRDHPLDDDLGFLHGQGIRLVVSLTEDPLPPEALERHGLAGLHVPVVDFTAPTLDQLGTFVQATTVSLAALEPVAVHCAGGKGRTGTFLAAWEVSQGKGADEAIAAIRALRPGSIETDEQAAAVRAWADRVAADRSPATADLDCPTRLDVEPAGPPRRVPPGWRTFVDRANFAPQLSSVALYDGPPEEMASLVPSEQRDDGYAWDLAPGRTHWLVCRYTDAAVQLTRQVPEGAKRCAVQTDLPGGVTVAGMPQVLGVVCE